MASWPEQLLAPIQVIKKRADGGGTGLPYPCSELNDKVGDDPGLVHLPSSVQCSENCVTHGNRNPVWLFRIEDGDEESEETPMPRIRAVFNGVSVFGAGQRLEAIFDVLILPPRHSATSRAEVIYFPPALLRPLGWCRSD
jgi:hypothetical protein